MRKCIAQHVVIMSSELVEVVKMSRVVVSSSRDVDSVASLHLLTYGRVILLF